MSVRNGADERRRLPRYSITQQVGVARAGDGEELPGELVELSMGGGFVACKLEVAVGDGVELLLTQRGSNYVIPAEVAYVAENGQGPSGKGGIGVHWRALSPSVRVAVQELHAAAVARSAERPKILAVDDRPENLFAVRDALKGVDADIVTALSGEEALSHILRHQFALILMDVQMPGMDGFETAGLIRSNEDTADVPILFVTAFSREEANVFKGYESGAVDYLFKPVDPFVLKSKVAVFLELHEKNRSLKKTNAERNHLLGMAAHDIRNPVVVIREYCELLRRSLESPTADCARALDGIHSSSSFVLTLLEDILAVSRASEGGMALDLEATNLSDLVERVVGLNRVIANRKEIAIESAVGEGVSLLVDGGKLEQVLNNLLSNAIKYSERATKVTVGVEVVTDGEKLVILSVADEGQGIPAAEMDRLFEPFTTLSVRPTEGESSTGLGLAIAKKIVDGHGGRIWVESTVEVGSTFYVALPYAPTAHVESPSAQRSGESAGGKVLVVDDSELLLDMTRALLEEAGFDVATLVDPAAVRATVEVERPDLVLSDVNLPLPPGADSVVELLGAEGSRPAVLFYSSMPEGELREKANACGATGYISKTSGNDKLIETVASVIREASRANP